MPYFCLTIAGSDPSSGAGIQADIRTIDRIGVYPFSVITAITYQSATRFFGFKSLSDDLDNQLKALFDIYPIKYVKVGMIPDIKSLDIIAEYIKKYNLVVVLDPVSISSAGKRLSEVGIEDIIEKRLFPLISVITPNSREAELYTNTVLTQVKLNDVKKVEECASHMLEKMYGSEISESHPKAVIIKSVGSTENIVFDMLCMAEGRNHEPKYHIFKKPRVLLNTNIHGTGCVFSSAIAAYLAKGKRIFDAVKLAEAFFDEKFQKYIELPDRGYTMDLSLSDNHLSIIEQVKEIYSFLINNKNHSRLIPEVRMNISGALPYATKKEEIAAIEGRITIVGGYPYASGEIKFGVSDHTARLILEAKKYDPSINFVMNLKYDDSWISLLHKKTSLQIQEIEREQQPVEIKNKEYSTMQWIIQETMNKMGRFPDIIWDKGAIGKEPIIRLFGKDSKDMIQKLKIISEVLGLRKSE
ncbi:MAG: bifunctional hydroxymethylpyrimidine kinase/phosphomethylpyrimidine kinase [Candidatus Thorarchaeota archaeon]